MPFATTDHAEQMFETYFTYNNTKTYTFPTSEKLYMSNPGVGNLRLVCRMWLF